MGPLGIREARVATRDIQQVRVKLGLGEGSEGSSDLSVRATVTAGGRLGSGWLQLMGVGRRGAKELRSQKLGGDGEEPADSLGGDKRKLMTSGCFCVFFLISS